MASKKHTDLLRRRVQLTGIAQGVEARRHREEDGVSDEKTTTPSDDELAGCREAIGEVGDLLTALDGEPRAAISADDWAIMSTTLKNCTAAARRIKNAITPEES